MPGRFEYVVLASSAMNTGGSPVRCPRQLAASHRTVVEGCDAPGEQVSRRGPREAQCNFRLAARETQVFRSRSQSTSSAADPRQQGAGVPRGNPPRTPAQWSRAPVGNSSAGALSVRRTPPYCSWPAPRRRPHSRETLRVAREQWIPERRFETGEAPRDRRMSDFLGARGGSESAMPGQRAEEAHVFPVECG